MRERERERERESSIPRCRDNVAYENYKVAKREVKRWLKTLNVKFMMNYITSWGGWNEKIIFINMLRWEKWKQETLIVSSALKMKGKKLLVKE